MKITVRDAIISALCYADIFDFPLTQEEVKIWLPYVRNYPRRPVYHTDDSLCPSRHLFEIRKMREGWSSEKWNRARKVARLLGMIPTIQLVGVTGGLTRSNTKPEDDIDVLIITTDKTLWATRGLSTILLDFVHLRRRPADTDVTNLVCLNMFMSEDGLSVPKHERDLFSAHEVLLMTPLLDRNGAYKKFLFANRWVKNFLPNAWEEKVKSQKSKVKRKTNSVSILIIVIWVLRFVEVPAWIIQGWYMKKRRTTEIISHTVIRFHPRDARDWIKKKLGERLKRFNIPLDKIFYGR